MKKTFDMTQEHLDLLRVVYIDWNGTEKYGAPGINIKRPFGNSDIIPDMAPILGIESVPTDDGDTHWPPGTTETCDCFLHDLETALQIVLAVGFFKVGAYEASEYHIDWRLEAAPAPTNERR